MRLSKVLIFIFLFVYSGISFSQQYSFKSFSVEHGLAQSQVIAAAQDKRGFLWFGTNGGGVNRFDGRSFETFSTRNGLPDNAVQNIFQDSRGNIWLGTESGLSCFDGSRFINYGYEHGLTSVMETIEDASGKLWIADFEKGLLSFDGKNFRRYSTAQGLIDNTARNLTIDKNGHLWIATVKGISRFDGKTFKNLTKKDGLLENRTRVVYAARSGALWIGHSEGITIFDGTGFTYLTEKQGLIKGRIIDIREDSRGKIWIAGDGGLCYYDGKTITKIKTSDDQEDNLFNCTLEDTEGNIWAGTDGKGVLQLIKSRFFHLSHKDGLPNKSVFGIIRDRKGELWFGTQGGGITVWNGKTFRHYTTKNGLSDNNVYGFLEQPDGSMLIITSSGLNKFENGKFSQISSLAKEEITRIIRDRQGNIWVGSYEGLTRLSGSKAEKYSLDDSVKAVTVTDILEDHSGRLWICTRTNGIKIYDGKTVSSCKLPLGRSYKPWSIVEDKSHNIWLGLYGNGLLKYDPATGKQTLLTKRDGLIDDNILSMIIDKDGFIWLGTNSGVCKINTEEFNQKTGKAVIRNYGPSEGFAGIECNESAVFLESSGDIWFGTITGVSRYNAGGEAETKNLVQPQTHITDIRLIFSTDSLPAYSSGIDRNTGLPIDLKLPHKLNSLSFRFAGIHLSAPEKVSYQYMLAGIDKGWSSVTMADEATYSNLPPGNYTFYVKACNSEGVWNDKPVAFSFQIVPPFYRTILFYLLVVAVLLGMIFFYVKFRTYKLIKNQHELEKTVGLRTSQLHEEKKKVEEINVQMEMRNQQLAEANAKLELSNSQLEKLSIVARETDNLIFITDASGRLEWVNDGAVRMLGYTFDEIISIKGDSFFQISSNPEIRRLVDEAVKYKKSVFYETVNCKKDGSKYFGSNTLTPIFDKDGVLKQLVIIEADITYRKLIEEQLKNAHDDLEKRVVERTAELQRSNELLREEIQKRETMEQELIVARDRAEHADRLKSAFLTQISHEIRTPLNVILSYSSLLKSEFPAPMDEMTETVFSGIQSASQRLIRTIDLILNMSAVQSGAHDIIYRNLDLYLLLESMIPDFRYQIKDKDLKINLINTGSSSEIWGDEYTVTQIFMHLIENAIKYSDKGSVDVTIGECGNGFISVSVKDEGIGISDEYLPFLFQTFSQEETGYTRRFEGNGLGLALVKKYIEMNNGEISVRTKKGEGTEFIVKLKKPD